MKTRKYLSYLLLLIAILLVGCTNDKKPSTPTNTNPKIHGTKDQVIERGTKFIPLQGVTATDKEDGDLTDAIQVTTNVNYNVVGEYQVTYTVFDKDGNKATVTIKVEVVFNDKDEPIISGVADKEIIVGTEFDPMLNVISSDVVDGDLSADITLEGNVDIWTPGEYTLTYKSTDKSNNTATVTRKITVSLGYFQFKENVLPETIEKAEGSYIATISSGTFDSTLSTYGLAKLTFNAVVEENQEVSVTVTNATSINTITLVPATTEYTMYIRYDAELVEAQLKLTTEATITNIELAFGEAIDQIAPEITVPEGLKVVLPGNIADEKVLTPFIVRKLSATDNIDGVVTSKLMVDYSGITLGEFVGETKLPVYVVDSSNNRTEVEVDVEFTNVYNTGLIENEGFETDDHSQFTLNGGGGEPTIYIENGELITHTTKPGDPGWDSASSPVVKTDSSVLSEGNWYLLKFDAYAETARKMTVRIGLDTTEALGWIENFEGASNYSTPLTTEKQTYYVIFYVHSNKSEAGMSTIKMELKIGTYDWGAHEYQNPVHFDNMQVYLLSNENTAPVITPVEGLPTTFGAGTTLPDFKNYVTVSDLEDGTIGTDDLTIDTSKVDVNTPGTYKVTFTVSDGVKETTYELEITILATADTIAPVISVNAEEITVKEREIASIFERLEVTATDDIDGEIIVSAKNIIGEYDLNTTGTYTITIKVMDTSGNIAEKVVTINVLDSTAPVITSQDKYGIALGDEFDLFKEISATDNVDGDITLTDANILGEYDLTVEGVYTITVSVSDKAGNKAEKQVEITVHPASGDELLIDDFEGYENTDALNTSAWFRRWIGYGVSPEDLHDLVLLEEEGNKAVQYSYSGDGEAILIYQFNRTYPTKYRYIAFKMTTSAEKLRMWYYTENDPQAIAGIALSKLTKVDGVYYVDIHESGLTINDIVGFGLSMNYQAAGNVTTVDNVMLTTRVPEPTGDEPVTETVIYDFMETELKGENAEVTKEEGVVTIKIPNVGEWASFAKIKLALSNLVFGKEYEIVITAKADQARQLKFNVGQSLWAEPWMDHFIEAEADRQVVIGTEYQTYRIKFTYNKEFKDGGPMIELCLGNTGHAGDINNNNIYISEFKVVEAKPAEEPVTDTVVIDFMETELKGENAEVTKEEGVVTIKIPNVGEWASFAKMKLPLTGLEFGKTYEIVITVKADQARQLQFNVGQSLWVEPWMDHFIEAEADRQVVIGTEDQTYRIRFTYNKEFKDGGPIIELCLGNTGHAGDVNDNNVYISEFKVVEVKTGDEPAPSPVIYDFMETELTAENATVTKEEGIATINVTNVGEWASNAKMKLNLSSLVQGKTYEIVITVKADQARGLKFNVGQSLWKEPWMDHFIENEADRTIEISEEYVTYHIQFTYNKDFQDGGPIIEFCFGATGHAGDVNGNNIYISEFKVVEVAA